MTDGHSPTHSCSHYQSLQLLGKIFQNLLLNLLKRNTYAVMETQHLSQIMEKSSPSYMQSLEFQFIYFTFKTLEKYLPVPLNGLINILNNGLKRDDEEKAKYPTLSTSLRRIKSSLCQQQPACWS